MFYPDWDEYCTAVEESLPTLIQEYIGEDPAAFACTEAFHGLGLNKSQSALRVVLAFPWAEQGRPKKPCRKYRVFNQWSNPADCRTNGQVSQLPRSDHQPGQADPHGRCCGTSDDREAYG